MTSFTLIAMKTNTIRLPYVGQAFGIEREVIHKKSDTISLDIAYGITSRRTDEASSERVLTINRDHRCIENSCHASSIGMMTKTAAG